MAKTDITGVKDHRTQSLKKIVFKCVRNALCFPISRDYNLGETQTCSCSYPNGIHHSHITIVLTLKAPNKIYSRRHFNFLLLSFEENKA